jgi:hypothetical protein
MIPENLALSVLTASITGAGLVIAFYALIAHMSDEMFENRFEQLEEKNREVEQIVGNRESFNREKLKLTTKRLEELSQEIDSIRTFPRYLGHAVAIDFAIFLFTAFLSLFWLWSSPESRVNMNDWMIPLLFLISVGLFAFVGYLGITDVMGTMKYDFVKLSKKKEKVKEDIKKGPEEARLAVKLVQDTLTRLGFSFQKTPLIKTDGTALIPDFVVPSAKNPKYLVEVLTWPNSSMIYHLSVAYQKLKSQTSAKTILVSDFGDRLSLLDLAKSYWDFVVDIKNLDILKEIVEK